MIPGTALISTVFREGSGIRRWLAAIAAQTAWPEEFVIVDGGSSDDTVDQINAYRWPEAFPKPRVIVQKCNIAEGRNLAIRHTTKPVIASTDAGSLADPHWFERMTRPFAQDENIAVVAGRCTNVQTTSFHRRLACYIGDGGSATSESVMPSSRCVAFRRSAWAAVGGYPEWLTLTAEDALFNYNLREVGFRFHYEPSAVVSWEMRPDLKSYLRMMYNYGYGWAEAQLEPRIYLRWLTSALLPPLILVSRHPIQDAPLRYLRNLASSAGWLVGLTVGHKAPRGWKKVRGILLSPDAVRFIKNANSKNA